MSQPTFPEIDIPRDCALNMLLASIAMEELALSHIINAEGEKLQYVLGTLNPCGQRKDRKADVDDILAVNESVTRLLEGVSQNQILLKNKMDRVLQAMETDPCRPEPPCDCEPPEPDRCYPEKCSAVFKCQRNGEIWREGHPLPWKRENIRGRRIIFNPNDNAKIALLPKSRYLISFSADMKNQSGGGQNASVSLRMAHENRRSDIFTLHCAIPDGGKPVTASAGGIITEPSGACFIFLELISPSSLIVDSSMLSIAEI